eukprot:TRINITY_DN4346_c0_g1_i1.p4 TRINITY_DN4346_c0_g1~~TRINITY_DN4346_c0_g1_i1.p4  ORF type:complete len:111 (-),score=21.25 TRINITY_DN4346_c0_g1_i1:73-405(-)
MVCNLSGLNGNSSYGISVHQYGDLTQGSQSLGEKVLNEENDGKVGEVKSDRNGNAINAWKNKNLSLFGVATIFGKGCSVWKEQKGNEMIGIGNISRAKEFVNIAGPLNQK